MNAICRRATHMFPKHVLNERYYHGTAVAHKYSYLNDMAKLRNPFNESSYKKILQWFTDSPKIDVNQVDNMDIWRKIGGEDADIPGEKKRSTKAV